MKKILLGTSALCAVAVAGPAFAQTANEPVKLGIGGYFNTGYGAMISQSGLSKNGKRTDDIDTDAILNIKGSTKLDNGLVVGASVQLRATNQIPSAAASADLTTPTGDTVKRSYVYITSDYGEIRIGDDDDARVAPAVLHADHRRLLLRGQLRAGRRKGRHRQRERPEPHPDQWRQRHQQRSVGRCRV